MRAAAAACVLLLLLLGAASAGAQPGELDRLVPPSPAPNGFIADGGPVLDAAALARLNARIAELQRTTGGDVGVAILRDLHDRAPADVGVAIYRAWKIGRTDSIGAARRDLGAPLLIVPKELAPSHRGECWVTTGRGAEATLIDAAAGALCRDSVIPHLKARDYAGAISAGVEAIAVRFADATPGAAPGAAPIAPPSPASVRDAEQGAGGRHGAAPIVVTLLLGGVGAAGATAGALRWRRRRPRPCPRGHGEMVRLSEADDDAALDAGQRTEERIASIDYDVWACPACAERTIIPYGAWRSSFRRCPSCRYRTVRQSTHTMRAATRVSTGLEEITLTCEHCGWHDVTRRTMPMLPPPSSSGSSGGGGGGGVGSGFGGSGSTSGGGGGSSY